MKEISERKKRSKSSLTFIPLMSQNFRIKKVAQIKKGIFIYVIGGNIKLLTVSLQKNKKNTINIDRFILIVLPILATFFVDNSFAYSKNERPLFTFNFFILYYFTFLKGSIQLYFYIIAQMN